MSGKFPSTPFATAVKDLIKAIDDTIPLSFRGTVTAYVVGGVATHIYTESRVSTDLDVKFDPPLLIAGDVSVTFENGGQQSYIRLDRNYTDIFAMMHPVWQRDAWDYEQIGRFVIKVISPLDLAVSKIARFAENDQKDIESLARSGLLDPDALEERCREALSYYVGDTTFVEINIRDTVEMVRSLSNGRDLGY